MGGGWDWHTCSLAKAPRAEPACTSKSRTSALSVGMKGCALWKTRLMAAAAAAGAGAEGPRFRGGPLLQAARVPCHSRGHYAKKLPPDSPIHTGLCTTQTTPPTQHTRIALPASRVDGSTPAAAHCLGPLRRQHTSHNRDIGCRFLQHRAALQHCSRQTQQGWGFGIDSQRSLALQRCVDCSGTLLHGRCCRLQAGRQASRAAKSLRKPSQHPEPPHCHAQPNI